MKTNNSVRIIGATVVTVLLAATQAQAIIAFNFPNLDANQNYASALSLGEIFTVNSSIYVNRLAAYDDPSNGLGTFGGPVSVAIYSISLSGNTINSGTLAVNPLTFQTGDAGTLLAGTTTTYKDISPVQLIPGTYMIVASGYSGGGEANWNQGSTGGPTGLLTANTGGGLVSYGQNYYATANLTWNSSLPNVPSGSSPNWVYDIVSDPLDNFRPRYMAGNFDFTPVPEVATFGAAAVGLLGLVYAARHVRIRRKVQGD
jgi:hypothetical protein